MLAFQIHRHQEQWKDVLFSILLSTFDNIFIYLLIVAMIQWEAGNQMMTSLLLQYRSICGQITLNQGTIITNEVLWKIEITLESK